MTHDSRADADASSATRFGAIPGGALRVGRATAVALAIASGALYWLAFTQRFAWPLAFVSLVPLLVALRGRSGFGAFCLGWLTGTVINAAGFYWIVPMLRTFSGFPVAVCAALGLLLHTVQGLEFALLGWFVARADQRGWPRAFSLPAALGALELAFPMLFPSYTANSLHHILPAIQTADLGGPILVSALIVWPHAAIDTVIATRNAHGIARCKPLLAPALCWLGIVGYGLARIHQVERENAWAPAIRTAVVQENLGLMEKRNEPEMALERHLEVSRRLERDGVQFIVWSESAVAFFIPSQATNIRTVFPQWELRVPVLFGALLIRDDKLYNTAFMVDGGGTILGTYDKTYLLAFGEYLPGGTLFPALYRWSPNSGHFTPGSRLVALPLPPSMAGAVTTLVCYEDILPAFVRRLQRTGHGSLLAVILNDAWFGDSSAPWMHLALSAFRSIELRRDFVRAANSGVSGFIDATGRVTAHTGTFTRDVSIATVHLRTRHTVYESLGDWPGWLGLGALAWLFAPRRLRRATA